MVVVERHAGALPSTVDDLKKLPGVGEYTAGAVASIAFGRTVPAVDGNVRRVLSRLFDLPDPGASELRELASVLVDPARPGDFNQAMMELGATVCTPRAPACSNCPLGPVCEAYREGTVEERPLRKVKRAVSEVDMAVLVAVRMDRGGQVAAPGSAEPKSVVWPPGRDGVEFFLRKRPTLGLLAGMWEFPGVEMKGGAAPGMSMAESAGSGQRDLSTAERAGSAVRALAAELGMSSEGPVLSLETLPHQFSHLKARYHPVLVRVQLERTEEEPVGRWVAPDGLDRLALPVAQQKIASLAMEAVRKWE
jgi:A/G-specific adenine glycosylase